MEIGHFYFIKDNFYIDFPNVNLMKNHQATENSEHNRPCFYSIKQDNGIIWLIPISSKVEKYKKDKGYNLIFGNVLQIENELLEKISKHQPLTV